MEANRVLCDLRLTVHMSHAPHLLSLINQVLNLASVPLDSIDLFAASQGPGSFTGLRIGIATLLGFSQALHRPLAGVDTLEALALKAPLATHPVCSMLDARKGEIFVATFRITSAGPARLTPNLVLSPEAFCAMITEPTILLGTGVDVYRGIWETHLGDLAIFPPSWLGMPCHVEVGALAFAHATSDPAGPQSMLVPTYVRPSEAEVNWSRRHEGDQSLM